MAASEELRREMKPEVRAMCGRNSLRIIKLFSPRTDQEPQGGYRGRGSTVSF